MSIETCAIVGSICALVATILLYIFVFPKSREGCLNRFFKTVKKLLGSGYLLIEKVAKFIYVLQTMGCIFFGFWLLFAVEKHYYYGGYNSYYRYYTDSYTESEWVGFRGLIVMIAGPIICRLIYELFIMIIMLIKNVMDIRNKLVGESEQAAFGGGVINDAAVINTAPKAPRPAANAPVSPAVHLEKEPRVDETDDKSEFVENDTSPEQ